MFGAPNMPANAPHGMGIAGIAAAPGGGIIPGGNIICCCVFGATARVALGAAPGAAAFAASGPRGLTLVGR